ncbi:MAG: carboxypeptidase-like regulatory domain-containing protein [Candidatus Sumerlaeia bacterium]|nr:carboxypeptidase-like regulatory domain-containing protein [Candidatus Sumerlaeia bacterium]
MADLETRRKMKMAAFGLAAVAMLGLAAVVATRRADGPSPTPAPRPAPRPEVAAPQERKPDPNEGIRPVPGPDRPKTDVQFVARYRVSGAPASGLEAIVRDLASGRSERFTVAKDGGFPASASASSVTMFDPVSSLTLAEIAQHPAGGSEFDLPVPAKLRARAVLPGGKAADGVSLRFANYSGVRAAWGLELGDFPANWQTYPSRGDGTVETDWLALDELTGAVLYDNDDRYAFVDPVLSEPVEAHATLDLGDIELQEPARLAVNLTIPPDRDRAEVSLRIVELRVDAEDPYAVMDTLRMQEAVNPAVAEFSRGARPFTMDRTGAFRLAPMPPAPYVRIVATGDAPDKTVEHTVSFRMGETTTIDVDARGLFSPLVGTGRLQGTVTLEGTGEPLADVRVMVATGGERRSETVTDAQGRYELAGLPLNREQDALAMAFDAEGNPPRYSATRRGRAPAIESAERPARLDFQIPAFRWLIVNYEAKPPDLQAGLVPVVGLEELDESGAWQALDPGDAQVGDTFLMAEVSKPGTYRLVFTDGALALRRSEAVDFGPEDFRKEARFEPAPPRIDRLEVLILSPSGAPAANARVRIAPDIIGALTDDQFSGSRGTVELGPVECDLLDVHADHQSGFFQGKVPVTGSSITVRLQPWPTNPGEMKLPLDGEGE